MFNYVMDTTNFQKKLIFCAGNKLPNTIDEAQNTITAAVTCCRHVCDITD